MLVFRGSDNDDADFEQLAFAYDISADVLVDMPPFGGDNIEADFRDQNSFGLIESLNGKTLAEMRETGLFEERLFVFERGRERFNIAVAWWPDAQVTVRWSVSASVFYGTDGDWAVNFAQGLGRNIPPQYDKAIRDGEEAARQADRDVKYAKATS